MIVRGAPLIGAAAAYGMALAMARRSVRCRPRARLRRAARARARPRSTCAGRWTTCGRCWRRCRSAKRREAAYRRAAEICDEDVEICRRIGEQRPAPRSSACKPRGERLNALTHCNAGWLATVDWGTALSPIYQAHDAGIPIHVWVDETRPRNQGASLTAWELGQARRAAHRDRRQCRRPPDAARQGRLLHRRHRPHDAPRRRLQQDRHLPEGAGGARQRRAVLCRPALSRRSTGRSTTGIATSRSRSARATRSRASSGRTDVGRDRHRRYPARGQPGRQPGLRRHARRGWSRR